MTTELLLTNATIITPSGADTGAIGIAGGRIDGIYHDGRFPEAATVIDLRGYHVLPGVVDIHVHFREPGQEYKATYGSESSAAAVGGVTTIFDMPNNGAQAVVNVERFLAKIAVARGSSYVDFGAYAYLCSKVSGEVRALADAGVAGLKWDMSLAGTEVAPGVRLPLPEEALPFFQCAARAGVTIGIHAEDRPLVLERTRDLAATGRADAAAHVIARPVEAETVALAQALDLCRRSGARLHVHHLSSAAGLELVRAAKREGLPVTAETIPPFLFLDARDYERLGTVMKIHPAVKYETDQEALWQGLVDGSIDCVATDHAPHTLAEKRRGVWEASPGAIGVQTSLPLMLDAVRRGRVTLERCVEVMSAAPARLYGLWPRKGAIVPGADADLVAVDLNATATIRNQDMLSPNRLTPFDGVRITGVPLLTLLHGEVVARAGVVVGTPRGVHVRPDTGGSTGNFEASSKAAQ